MNVQPPKENEIVLLSGLASGSLQAGYEVPQVGINSSLRSQDTWEGWNVENGTKEAESTDLAPLEEMSGLLQT